MNGSTSCSCFVFVLVADFTVTFHGYDHEGRASERFESRVSGLEFKTVGRGKYETRDPRLE